jgi:hypothetical protein
MMVRLRLSIIDVVSPDNISDITSNLGKCAVTNKLGHRTTEPNTVFKDTDKLLVGLHTVDISTGSIRLVTLTAGSLDLKKFACSHTMEQNVPIA